MPSLPDRIAHRITARWWAGAIALGLLLLAGLVTGLAGDPSRQAKPTDPLPTGSDSAAAAQLRERLPATQGSSAVVLFSREGAPLTDQDQAVIRDRVASAAGGAQLPVVPSQDGTAALAVVPVNANSAQEAAPLVTTLRDAVKADLPNGLSAQVTGPAAVEADLAGVFEGANTRLLLTTASIVAILLVLTYRSPILWLVPLTVIGVADRVAMVAATHTLSALDVAGDESTTGILSVLVFGAGTDYALLLISRYRDELRRHPDRREAMALALRRTAEAVLSSSVTVVAGVLTLLLSAFPTTRGLGLASAIGIVTAAFFALVVLPAALVVFGRWIFWPRIPHEGETALVDSRSVWRRVGDVVAARPWTVIAVTLVGLLAAGAVGTGIKTGLSNADQFLKKPEAIAAAERLAQSFPAGEADPAIVVTAAEPNRVLAAVRRAPAVQSARITRQGNGVAQIDAVMKGDPASPEVRAGVASLRQALSALPQTHVGGTEATALDASEAAASDRWLIFPLILALVLVALVLLLRSIVAPLVLVTTVLLSFVASLGLSWLLFRSVFGFERLDDTAPLYAFVFLVALGVDYNIFLVTRAREEARAHGTRQGILRALTATGGVITSAGILLAAVFAVLGLLPLVVLAQVGVIIGVGVLLDTLVVRTVLVPAIAVVLGDRFWWPRRVTVTPTRGDTTPAAFAAGAGQGAG